MNRDLSFRVWDRVDGVMRNADQVDGTQENPSLLAVGFHGLPICIDSSSFKEKEIVGWNRDHNLVLMQSTGVRDCDGTMIYEGDLVEVHQLTHTTIYAVVFQSASFDLVSPETPITGHLGGMIKDLIRVVGNVFQNQELVYKKLSLVEKAQKIAGKNGYPITFVDEDSARAVAEMLLLCVDKMTAFARTCYACGGTGIVTGTVDASVSESPIIVPCWVCRAARDFLELVVGENEKKYDPERKSSQRYEKEYENGE